MARPSLPRLCPALRDGAPVLEVLAALTHQRDEDVMVARYHRRAQALDCLGQGLERFRAVVVEALDLEVELRTLLRHAARDVELRVESGAREPRQTRRSLAAFRERSEECDVESVR